MGYFNENPFNVQFQTFQGQPQLVFRDITNEADSSYRLVPLEDKSGAGNVSTVANS